MKTIDLTPTWGEWGNVFWRFAISGEREALKPLRHDMAKALAAAQAFKEIQHSLPDDLYAQVSATFHAEMAKQGFPQTSEEVV
jgi:hypothetical protein